MFLFSKPTEDFGITLVYFATLEKNGFKFIKNTNLIDFFLDFFLVQFFEIIVQILWIKKQALNIFPIINNADKGDFDKLFIQELYTEVASLSSRIFDLLKSFSTQLSNDQALELILKIETCFVNCDHDSIKNEIIAYRSLCHNIYLNQEQIFVLEKYYDFALLLTNCLNIECEIDKQSKENIRENILLSFID